MTTTMRRVLAGVVAVGLAATGLAACVTPITPSVGFIHSTFEGYDVVSYVPEHPKAVVYLFHGSQGSAAFAEKVETTAVLNAFVADGYGFVSTESTERTGDRRWDQGNPSLTTNPDLARLTRLQQHLVQTTGMVKSTPLVGIGMSNGARFVTLWGQTWHDAGYEVKAVWASHGRVAEPAVAAGGLTVPTYFTTAVNDYTVPPFGVIQGYTATHARGTPTALSVSAERPLAATQYQRIPGIDATEAAGIVSALEATGVWDDHGVRVVPDVQQAVAQSLTAVLPPTVVGTGVGNEVVNETALMLAVHQFTAEFVSPVRAFFDQYVG